MDYCDSNMFNYNSSLFSYYYTYGFWYIKFVKTAINISVNIIARYNSIDIAGWQHTEQYHQHAKRERYNPSFRHKLLYDNKYKY